MHEAPPNPPGNPYLASNAPNANPYAAPTAHEGALPANAGDAAPAPRTAALYTPGNVMLATFLGTPLGGSIVLALNESRLGRKDAAVFSIIGGLLGTTALLALSFVLPDNLPVGHFIGLGSLIALGSIARRRQGQLVSRHLAGGGKKGSGWAAAGIGLLSLVAVLVPLVAILMIAEMVTAPS